VGAGGAANLAGGCATGSQRKVTSLRRPWGCPSHGGVAGAAAELEAAGGNRVCPATYLEPEEVVAPGQQAVRAIIQRL
jgi:hypothetical protein